MSATPPRGKPNRLIDETSPYLLQHAYNPTDWHPWGPEAFARAVAEDKPIFLSVGYSACHWCHVMERESFENADIAALMNEYFVNIKVDREERPDVDQIYMAAVQAMTRQGGWPMSVFLTPEGKPFFGGTYFPPSDSRGMAGFARILVSVAKAWRERREEIVSSAGELTDHLKSVTELRFRPGELDPEVLDGAFLALSRSFDSKHGGFGSAPKFPHPMDLKLLLRIHRRTGDPRALNMVRLTLDKMARGGMYDQLAGGFARYSTDDRWLVPHFEKMLYDNALLSGLYLESYQATRDAEHARVAREILDYVLGRMTSPEGGFYSTEDADSEGVEGKYYVWSLDELLQVLGEEKGATFAEVYGASAEGNWEEANILNLPVPMSVVAERLGREVGDLSAELAASRARLLEVRERRVPPGKDEKILTSWNGLMIASLAQGSRTLRDEKYLRAAERACEFVLTKLRGEDGLLLHSHKDGRAKFNAYLDDYACFIDGLTRVFEAGGGSRARIAAEELAEIMIREFADDGHAFNYTGRGHESLIARPKEIQDNATPSSNGMAATALLRLASLTGREDFRRAGLSALKAAEPILREHPSAMGQSLIALDIATGPRREIALIPGADRGALRDALEAIARNFDPYLVVAPRTESPGEGADDASPLFEGRVAADGRITAYLCENSTCLPPIVGIPDLIEALRS